MVRPADEIVGTRFGSFEVEGRLAHQPGVLSVYAARDRRDGRPAVLRVLRVAGGHAAAAHRAHARATSIWSALAHPGLVPLLDAGSGPGGVWVVTARPCERTLARHLEETGALDPARAIGLLVPVGAALDAVHGRGLVCDALTAGSVLVCGPAGEEQGRLTDVGPAWPPGRRAGRLLGDVDGLAPEEIRGLPPTPASNVYSLSALLFRCLTESAPFPAGGRAATLAAHLHATPPRAEARRPGLPAALDDVIAAGLAKRPAERPASAGELLRQAADALEAPVRPPSPMTRSADVPRPVARRRSRLLLVVPAAAIVALAGYLALQPGSERHPVRAAPVPAAPPGKGRALASATLRPTGPGVRKAIGAVRVDGRGRRLVLTIAAEHLQAEERSPAQAYTVWLLNSRRDALRLGVIDPPVGAGGSFRSHGTLPPGSRRYHRIVVTLETQLERQPGGPIVLAGGLRIPPAP